MEQFRISAKQSKSEVVSQFGWFGFASPLHPAGNLFPDCFLDQNLREKNARQNHGPFIKFGDTQCFF